MISRVRLPSRHPSASAKPGPPPDPPPKPVAPPPPGWRCWLLPIALAITLLLLFVPLQRPAASTLSYSDFVARVNVGQVKSVSIDDKGAVQGTLQDGSSFTSQVPTALNNGQLGQQLQSKNVQITATQSGDSWGPALLSFLPLLLLLAFFIWTGRQAQRSLVGGIGGFGRSKAKIIEAQRPTTRFADVAGYDGVKQEIGGGMLGGHEEREQTLNQLLAEMDGFDQTIGIVVLAASNRPEALDRALLRPGRFDRQVTVPLPNQAERAAILAVHAAGKHLGPDVDLDALARATPGFSGADLANLVNEAAINAVRADRITIDAHDLDAARDRVLLGRRETSNALLPEERRAVAVHESGHALLAALCEHADPVAKVTILPSGLALGATEQLPEAERHLYNQAYLIDLLTVRLAGRAAELVVFGQGSTGAANDLTAATQIGTRMVREFGLSPALGPVGYSSGGAETLGAPAQEPLQRPYSEHTQRVVDQEVARLLREAEERAVDVLRAHRPTLDRLAAILVEHETVDGAVVLQVLADERQTNGQQAESIPLTTTAMQRH